MIDRTTVTALFLIGLFIGFAYITTLLIDLTPLMLLLAVIGSAIKNVLHSYITAVKRTLYPYITAVKQAIITNIFNSIADIFTRIANIFDSIVDIFEYSTGAFSKELRRELEGLENDRVHYESSFYGPHNHFLFHYFHRGFLVKPQARLREQVDAQDVDQSSQDSTGQHVGTSQANVFPDFVVVRLTPRGHQPILLWEVKRGDSGAPGEDQVGKYARWASRCAEWMIAQGAIPQSAHAVLVEKGLVRVFQCLPGSHGIVNQIAEYPSLLDEKLDAWLRAKVTGKARAV